MADTIVPLTEEDLHELYVWVDEIPLSRPKRNIARDFSDGCSVAEILKYYFPKIVDLHNYAPAMSTKQKVDNWRTLNSRIFLKLHFEAPEEEINDLVAAVPGAIERFLRALRTKIMQIKVHQEGIEKSGSQGMLVREKEKVARHAIARSGAKQGTIPSGSRQVEGGAVAQHTALAPGKKKAFPLSRDASKKEVEIASDNEDPSPSQEFSAPNQLREMLNEKDQTIFELRETVSLLGEKVSKLEELLRVKDEKLSGYRTKYGRL